jgi:ankyrin repeat protein
MAIDPQLVADQFLRVFNDMAQNGHHQLARSLSGLARVTRVDDNLWDAICYNSAQDKRTPFMYACQKGDVDRVNFLLPHCGAEELYHDYSLRDGRDGPLFIAARYGHPAVVATLCKYITDHKIEGALDFLSATNGWTPLMVAVSNVGLPPAYWIKAPTEEEKARFREVATCLVQHGCDLNAEDECGAKVLYQAILRRDSEQVSFVCSLGVDVNFLTCGRSPLQEAIYWNNLEIATILCDHGAEIGTLIEYAKTLNRGGGWEGWGEGRWTSMIALLESRVA